MWLFIFDFKDRKQKIFLKFKIRKQMIFFSMSCEKLVLTQPDKPFSTFSSSMWLSLTVLMFNLNVVYTLFVTWAELQNIKSYREGSLNVSNNFPWFVILNNDNNIICHKIHLLHYINFQSDHNWIRLHSVAWLIHNLHDLLW